jgi:hypothetical protein
MREDVIRRSIKSSMAVLGVILIGLILQLPLATDSDSTTVGIHLKMSMPALAIVLLFTAVQTILSMKV